ncbi:MAG: hypothetical protein KC434_19270, partial [Anaerolineales bacterium]|nr:hypothetical protein [Anaerolineales bacterium]
DPLLTCAWGGARKGYRTVWYQFTPSSNGRVTIDTSNNFNPDSYDTILAVYTGSCATLSMVACNDDYQGFASRVTFNVSQNVTYFVEVADWNAGEPGTLELDIFFLLDPIPSKWTALTAQAPARTRHASVKVGGQIYVVGGQTNAVGTPMLSSTIQRYAPGTDTWTTLPSSMPGAPLTDITAAYWNGRIYIPGGYDGNGIVGTHNVYNVAAGVWEPTAPPPPAPVAWAQAVVPADQGGYYLVGGISNTNFLTNTATVENGVSFFNGTWNPGVPDMNVPRYGHTAVWANNGIYVVGGIDDNFNLLPGGEYYQPAGNGQWDPLPPMNIARYGAASAVAPDGKWYVFGGLGSDGKAVSEVEVLDPKNPGAGWKLLDVTFDLGDNGEYRARAFPEGQFIGNYLYAIGGHDTDTYFVTPVVQRLLALGEANYLPVVMDGSANPFNDNFGAAQRILFNAAQIHQFNDSFDFFDAYYFDQPNTSIVTVRLSQIPTGSNYDLTVYDANKSVRGSSTQVGSLSEATTLLLPPGRYYIMVERIFGQSDGSNYRLIVEK